MSSSIGSLNEHPDKKKQRLERFKDHIGVAEDCDHNYPTASTSHSSLSPRRSIKGLSQQLEKPYLRLTSSPDPRNIRPISILKQSLQLVKEQYCENSEYSYACEQLKSIRQDLTIQNINSRFTAHVYETHARIALECGDLPEYNQCQSRLIELKAKGVPISADEFTCYALLHALLQGNFIELLPMMRATATDLSNECCPASKYALNIIRAVRNSNWTRFFILYASAPHMSVYLLDYMLLNIRDSAFDRTLKSFAAYPLEELKDNLYFKDIKEGRRFMKRRRAVFIDVLDRDESVVCVDTKETLRAAAGGAAPAPVVVAKASSTKIVSRVVLSAHEPSRGKLSKKEKTKLKRERDVVKVGAKKKLKLDRADSVRQGVKVSSLSLKRSAEDLLQAGLSSGRESQYGGGSKKGRTA